MTSDYVDAVLFQLRWEAFEDLDGYFMGCYDKPEPCSDDDSTLTTKLETYSSLFERSGLSDTNRMAFLPGIAGGQGGRAPTRPQAQWRLRYVR